MPNPVLSPTPYASESGHFYTRSGEPAYEVIGANGNPRPTTIRDARKLDLVPGVSTIIKCAAQESLGWWKVEQGILAALTLPRLEGEPEKHWLARVREDGQEQAKKAAERGTELHGAIERMYRENPYGLPTSSPEPAIQVARAIDEHFGIGIDWKTEVSFATESYGGKTDLVSDNIIIDFKGKDPEAIASGKPLAYDEHAMQLAAYAYGLGLQRFRCANVFFSRQEPWLVRVYEWSRPDLERGYEMFRALLSYWKAKNKWEMDDGRPF